VAYCPHCDGPLFKGKDVAVIGGGNSGVEAAIDLAGVVRSVTLLEFADQLKADQVLVDKLRSLPNVSIHVNAQTTQVVGDGQKMTGLRWKDRVTGAEHAPDLELIPERLVGHVTELVRESLRSLLHHPRSSPLRERGRNGCIHFRRVG
jgi:alkyl hydroperoxide reductase subunit AhpF